MKKTQNTKIKQMNLCTVKWDKTQDTQICRPLSSSRLVLHNYTVLVKVWWQHKSVLVTNSLPSNKEFWKLV